MTFSYSVTGETYAGTIHASRPISRARASRLLRRIESRRNPFGLYSLGCRMWGLNVASLEELPKIEYRSIRLIAVAVRA